MKNAEELGKSFRKDLAENKKYLEALSIVRKNSEGKIWLIGSGIYKNILNTLYNLTYNVKDWDFVVERIVTPIKLATGWKLTETKHGNPKLKKGDFIIDLIALDNIHSIKERGLEPDIRHYLSGTPLTIQSIAFDVDENKLLGKLGIRSILTKTVEINNKAEYDYATSIYGERYSMDCYASTFGFNKG